MVWARKGSKEQETSITTFFTTPQALSLSLCLPFTHGVHLSIFQELIGFGPIHSSRLIFGNETLKRWCMNGKGESSYRFITKSLFACSPCPHKTVKPRSERLSTGQLQLIVLCVRLRFMIKGFQMRKAARD